MNKYNGYGRYNLKRLLDDFDTGKIFCVTHFLLIRMQEFIHT